MRIFSSPGSDPMLLDSYEGMRSTWLKIHEFVGAEAFELVLSARTDGSAEPYDEFLERLRIRKAEGPLLLTRVPDGYLYLVGSADRLERYAEAFQFQPEAEASHRHPELFLGTGGEVPGGLMARGTMCLIIEMDTTYIKERDGGA